MALGVILVSGATRWYQVLNAVSVKQKISRENRDIGRTLLQFIMADIQASGYRGCRTLDDNFPMNRTFAQSGPFKYFSSDRSVFGFQVVPGICHAYLPQTACARIVNHTAVLIVYNIPRKMTTLKCDMNKRNAALLTEGISHISVGSVVLISDWMDGDFFVANDVQAESIFHQKTPLANLSNDLSKKYKKGADITELQTIAYYLGMPLRENTQTATYSLYRDDLFQGAEEILTGIVSFSVEYAIMQNDKKIVYKSALRMKEDQWAQVQGVRIQVTTKTNHVWEYYAEIRNRRRPSLSVNINHSAFLSSNAYDGTSHFNR